MFVLSAQAPLRLVIEGLRRADGKWKSSKPLIYTSGVKFRDSLLHLLMHAGFSPYFTLMHRKGTIRAYHGPDRVVVTVRHFESLGVEAQRRYTAIKANHDSWAVNYAEPKEDAPPTEFACYPSMARTDIATVKDTSAIWCVTVEHDDHLVVMQRAYRPRGPDGQFSHVEDQVRVTKAGRPMIIGQCGLIAAQEDMPFNDQGQSERKITAHLGRVG